MKAWTLDDSLRSRIGAVALLAIVVVLAVCLVLLWLDAPAARGEAPPPSATATPPADWQAGADLSVPFADVRPGEPLSVAVLACEPVDIEVSVEAGGERRYWPGWGPSPLTVPVDADSYPAALWPVLAVIPADAGEAEAWLRLRAWVDGGALHEVRQRIRILPPAVPSPTATPAPTPTPDGCPAGSATFHVDDIPEFTNSNKGDLNKGVLACVHGGDCIIAVIQRYYQPAWPVGEWWPVWRLEVVDSANEERVVGWRECGDLVPGSAVITIGWNGADVWARMVQGDCITEEGLAASVPLRVSAWGEDEACAIPGYAPFHSSADIEPPLPRIDCGQATPVPSGYVSGWAVIDATGIEAEPSEAADKAAVAALVAADGRWCAIRHRNRPDRSGGYLQLKGASGWDPSDECWSETNLYQTTPARNGEIRIAWGVDGRSSWVEISDGISSQHIEFDYIQAWELLRTGECPECRGSPAFGGAVTVEQWQPGERGDSEACQ